jgi:hypothetical protein
MDGSLMTDEQDVYLHTRYHDGFRKLTTERIYYIDGRVRVYTGKEWRLAHWLSAAQIQHLQETLIHCGVTTGENIQNGDAHDTATLSWRWKLNGQSGELVNYAYPAFKHPAMDCAYLVLNDLEKQAQPCEE